MNSPELPSWKRGASESNKQALSEFFQKPGGLGRWSQEAAEGGD